MELDPPAGSASEPALTIETADHPPYTLVSLSGEIDVGSVGRLRPALRDLVVDGSANLLLDLSGVAFMDSAGLGVLVGIQKQVRIFRGSLTVVAPSRSVRRIFELTSLDKVFRSCDTLEEALAHGHGARRDPVLD